MGLKSQSVQLFVSELAAGLSDAAARVWALFAIHGPVHLAIVRKYQDANGHNVGELYRYDTFAGTGSYRLIGCSLDSFPLGLGSLSLADEPSALDLKHDFLAPLPRNTLRVGALEPQDNDRVRREINRIPRESIRLVIQNRFIEAVLDRLDGKPDLLAARRQALDELAARDQELGL